ncbi:hypothetical protein BX616_007601 [Lobosporangium transversale]|uniref:Uncharacterized protein n=1 Tax=Lobosporangium transversale TaxID=64571 RepID=A0A1Y2G614_9FUNG|nr:hypothetical protein BCR41DRAFT_364747 [Lobosporangium transversale]KAF9918587.1 hypothetical protein BX616_007601 [Lobosporangium transversale]ORY96979.1 hypothetical protein BCR41DRAFT_364747 [Lobosporangium transversale]|eukprot:XP_021875541.1 hypothetical protein BCR41DRAFT_364747 [Lobosporangium transversale]
MSKEPSLFRLIFHHVASNFWTLAPNAAGHCCHLLELNSDRGVNRFEMHSSDIFYLLLPQTLFNLYTSFYCYFRIKKPFLSLFLAGTYIFLTARGFQLALGSPNLAMLLIVEGFNISIVLLLIAQFILVAVVFSSNKPPLCNSSISATRANSDEDPNLVMDSGDVRASQLIHVYQPRLSLISTQAAQASANDENHNADILQSRNESSQSQTTVIERVELEELPRYQRRPPTQTATIVDLSNLPDVDHAILNTTLGRSAQQRNLSLSEPSGAASAPVEAPVYSPPEHSSNFVSESESQEIPSASVPLFSLVSTSTEVSSVSLPTSEPPIYAP